MLRSLMSLGLLLGSIVSLNGLKLVSLKANHGVTLAQLLVVVQEVVILDSITAKLYSTANALVYLLVSNSEPLK